MDSSLDLPRTGKSISIALAFALRACVRAKLRGRGTFRPWLGVARSNYPGGSVRPGLVRSSAKPLPCFALACRSLQIAANRFYIVSRCFSLFLVASRCVPAASRCV